LYLSLKTAQRTGWTHYDIKHVESVSDHMYRMSIMTMLLNSNVDQGLDKIRYFNLFFISNHQCLLGSWTIFVEKILMSVES